MNVGMLIIVIIGALLGGIPTLYITLGMPILLGWKVYRKVRYNISLMD